VPFEEQRKELEDMAERTYDLSDLVALPRMSAHEALALARTLRAVATRMGELPKGVREALGELENASTALAAALPPKQKPPSILREADREEDNAVSTLVAFLRTWLRLPEERFPQEVALARRGLDVLLEGGSLAFLTYRPVVEHSEVQRRIDALRAQGLDRELRSLGAGPFLDHLLAVHAAYGEACAIPRTTATGDTPALRETMNELSDALRAYVVAVVASSSRKKPETVARAEELLHPLRAWVRSTPSNTRDPRPNPDPDPGPPPNDDPAVDRSKPKRASVRDGVSKTPAANDIDAARKVG
jgi:hypothetical protein